MSAGTRARDARTRRVWFFALRQRADYNRALAGGALRPMIFSSLDYLVFLALALVGFWTIRRFGPERAAVQPGAAVDTKAAARRGRDLYVGLTLVALGIGCFFAFAFAATSGADVPYALALGAFYGAVPLVLTGAIVLLRAFALAPFFVGSTATQMHARGSWMRLLFMVLASCVFYMAWNPYYIGLMLTSTVLDYVAAKQIYKSENPRVRKAWLVASLLGGLGMLGTFKYFNFFSQATGELLGLFGLRVHPPILDVLLPVGISFYTFETLSYTIDVYRRRLVPAQSFLKFAFFVTFFPHLVAGPIIRAAELLPQVDRPPWLTRERVGNALFLIGLGLAKKIVFADFISVNLVDRVFDDPAAFSSLEVLIGLYGFTLQIYADFSGYTDVARGSAMLFGIDLPENFDRPYQATSVADFWRRWHMTLSTWLRDYLYFPLGGSRHGPLRTYFNLWLTIFLIGLWHGASWTFVIYGNVQALGVMLNRFVERARERPPIDERPTIGRRLSWALGLIVFPWNWLVLKARRPDGSDPRWLHGLRILMTLQFVVFSRILFRSTNLDNAGDIVDQLAMGTRSTAQISGDVWRILVLGFYLHYVPRSQLEWLRARFVGLPAWGQGIVLAIVGFGLMLFVTGEVVPYIYFQF